MACKGNCNCNCKKAIITGITGQDGSHLADLLLEKNYKVIGVSRRTSTDNIYRIKHLLNHPNLKLVEGDITDYSSMLHIIKNHNNACELYNLAAQSHVGTSFKQPEVTWDATCMGCFNLLQIIVDLDLTKSMKFYQASSSEMFGNSYDSDGHGKHQKETTKFMPQNPYAIAKAAAHEAVRIYREAYGLHASAGILFNHEGPRRGEQFVTRKITKWIGGFVRSDRDADFPKLRLGNLEVYRDWWYAGDYVKAMWLMLQQKDGEDYVICTGESHTIREFLSEAFYFIGIKNWQDFIVQDPEFYRPVEFDYLQGRNSKAIGKLGWHPETNFKDLVHMMVKHDIEAT